MNLATEFTLIISLATSLMLSSVSTGGAPIKALIIDGQNNHDWRATTPHLKKLLDQTGLFEEIGRAHV